MIRTFLARVPWWMTAVWVLTVAAAVFSAVVGLWVNALALVVIGWLSVYGEALFQQLTETRAERDWWRNRYYTVRGLSNESIHTRLRLAARYPRADWEG